jgi:Leucine Rich repeat
LDQLSIFLWNNKKLEVLEMRHCLLDCIGSESLADGVARNSTLRHLDISSNRIKQESMARWQEVIGKCSLRYFDISCNYLYDEGAICIIKGLL